METNLSFLPEQEIKKIIHVDMDCFYAAVEMRDNPKYRNIPLAVGGSPEKRGVISTCNYIARKFGIHSAMSSKMALNLCPNLLIVPGSFKKYREASNKIREIFLRYSDLIQPLSLDEAFLDVTNSVHHEGSATLVAQEIKQKIKHETGLIASAGVAPNKFLAKIASDWKKPDGLYVITPKDVASFIKLLDVGKINGVGKVTKEKLNSRGIQTCSDIQKIPFEKFSAQYGKWGRRLYELSHGIDNSEVSNKRERKSLSVERTFSIDLPDFEALKHQLIPLINLFLERFNNYMEKSKEKKEKIKIIQKFCAKVKFSDFNSVTVEKSMPEEFYLSMVENGKIEYDLNIHLENLFKLAYDKKKQPFRLLGLGIKFKEENSSPQLCLL
jgi:DNA polymerase-4